MVRYEVVSFDSHRWEEPRYWPIEDQVVEQVCESLVEAEESLDQLCFEYQDDYVDLEIFMQDDSGRYLVRRLFDGQVVLESVLVGEE